VSKGSPDGGYRCPYPGSARVVSLERKTVTGDADDQRRACNRQSDIAIQPDELLAQAAA